MKSSKPPAESGAEDEATRALVAKWRAQADKAMQNAGVEGFGGGFTAGPLRRCADEAEPVFASLLDQVKTLREANTQIAKDRDDWKQGCESAEQQVTALRERASRLEDAAFHFQTCRTCAEDGEDSCPNGRRFAAFLRGEADAE